ncbi:hypothetical protein PHMEG_0003780 [Phytophthora megakarya]|uniref:Uncharacterized protein n=1 Tax=Phytophthora megakarya TaxID=4795 RepID=A0A225WXT1_9STRA|nr:hypothetical protein PHMEG_0003780 [Phytophthora megakarya]
MKNAHSEDRPRDPRHVHANSLQPAIWPILALAIYWATTTFDKDNRLFPRSDQYDPFQKGVQRLLIDVELSIELNRRGVNTSNLETHLMRKGGAIFSAWCYSLAIIYGGAFACGKECKIPIIDMKLPEICTWEERLQRFCLVIIIARRKGSRRSLDDISSGFRAVPEHFAFTGEFGFASPVYHIPYLRKHLRSRHPIFFKMPLCFIIDRDVCIADLSRMAQSRRQQEFLYMYPY